MVLQTLVNIGLLNGLLLNGAKPSPEPMMIITGTDRNTFQWNLIQNKIIFSCKCIWTCGMTKCQAWKVCEVSFLERKSINLCHFDIDKSYKLPIYIYFFQTFYFGRKQGHVSYVPRPCPMCTIINKFIKRKLVFWEYEAQSWNHCILWLTLLCTTWDIPMN